MERAYTPDRIRKLSDNEIIVVGTNIKGLHGGGAARYAHDNFGLTWGIGEGLAGQSYALPTMEGWLGIKAAANRFINFARLDHNHVFYLTKVGCGIAGYSEAYMREFFRRAPDNVIRPRGWYNDEMDSK